MNVIPVEFLRINNLTHIKLYRYNGFLVELFGDKYDSHYVIRCYEKNGNPIASLFAINFLGYVAIEEVFVEKYYRRLGLGAKMFDILFKTCGSKPYRLACITYDNGVTYGERRTFYNKLGFIDEFNDDEVKRRVKEHREVTLIKNQNN